MNKEVAIDCPCGSGKLYQDCCQPYIDNSECPNTSEQLMRSRYTAYALAKATYIIDTTHPRVRHTHSKKAIMQWAQENEWLELQVVKSEENRVIFKAYFKDSNQVTHCHFENSVFEKLGDKWYYLSGSYEE
ncbi:MAG: YchJ family protein [Flavobacteriaceae bacterium]|jgi:SEC-C motif-containing protein|nr:YchJ family protein [Flavobacteriaceae bacterium]